jgi:hypothetical protein
MQEFSSVSASSYDPAALAAKLTEKSAEGWSVVTIVPTGGDVTAFLAREAGAATAPAAAEPAVVEPAAVTSVFAPTAAAATVAAVEPTPAVAEPAGWAVAPEASSPAVDTTAAATAAAAATSMAPISDYQPAAQQTYQPAAQPAAAATPAVPAGWYADPAGRFELRYWDGNTWTEHVSRAGQQYTDPPVA